MAQEEQADQVDDTVQRLAELHEAHQQRATPRFSIWPTGDRYLGRPASLAISLLLMIGWMVGNYVARRLGLRAMEKFPSGPPRNGGGAGDRASDPHDTAA